MDFLKWLDTDGFTYVSNDGEYLEVKLAAIDNNMSFEDYYSLFTKTFINKTERLLIKNGFVKNDLNMGKEIGCCTNNLLAYEKDEVKCLLMKVNNLPEEYILKLTCGSVYPEEEQYNLQKEILNDLERYDEIVFDFDSENDFVLLSLEKYSTDGSYSIIVKKIDSKWTQVTGWTEYYPPCNSFIGYDIPINLLPGCYDEELGDWITRE
jgi:hypothetical protein